MSDVGQPARVIVDLDAVVANWAEFERLAQPGSSAAVVKANAYGLGAVPVARALVAAGCNTLFVATCAEGVALRDAGIRVTIYVLEGALAFSGSTLVAHDLAPVLGEAAQYTRWAEAGAGAGRQLPCALHVDTGMSRLGFAPDEFVATVPAGSTKRRRQVDARLLMTHLARADEPKHAANAQQLERFARARAHCPDLPTSIGNSAGALGGAATGGDLLRPGIALYGGNPFVDRRAVPLREVVQLRAPVLQVRQLATGDSVGYGGSYVASTPRRVATLGIGYADGYPRALGNRGWACLHGERVPVLGRVSMDLLVVDVTAVARTIAAGDEATLLGGGVPLDDLADAAGTIGYELLTRLGTRLVRQYVGAGSVG